MRGLRGGTWEDDEYYGDYLASEYRGGNVPSYESSIAGFRVASVPEPGCVALAMLAGGMMLGRRKR